MSVLGAATTLACALVLAVAAVGHLRDLPGTARAIQAHRVLPGADPERAGRGRPMVPLALGVVEGLLSLALMAVAVGLLGPGFDRWVSAAAAVLFAVFTGYLALALRRNRDVPGLPCGCGLVETPLGHWAVLRAGLLTVLMLTALVGGVVPLVELGRAEFGAAAVFVALAGGLSLAVVTAVLPAAREIPDRQRVLLGGAR